MLCIVFAFFLWPMLGTHEPYVEFRGAGFGVFVLLALGWIYA